MQVETERLILRQWREDDFEAFAAFYADDMAARFVGGACERWEAWRRMASLAGHWTFRGFGLWALEEKSSGEFVGASGLWRPEGWPELELGYWLVPAKHGMGYATEAGRAGIRHARDVVQAPSLVSYIHPDNIASQKVAERLGAQRDGMVELLRFGSLLVYRHAF